MDERAEQDASATKSERAEGSEGAVLRERAEQEDSDDARERPCPICDSTETIELHDERQSITICAECGSDE